MTRGLELWELAADDPDLRRFLGALAKGAMCKADVQFVTGMSDHDYHAARNRLDRLVGSCLAMPNRTELGARGGLAQTRSIAPPQQPRASLNRVLRYRVVTSRR